MYLLYGWQLLGMVPIRVDSTLAQPNCKHNQTLLITGGSLLVRSCQWNLLLVNLYQLNSVYVLLNQYESHIIQFCPGSKNHTKRGPPVLCNFQHCLCRVPRNISIVAGIFGNYAGQFLNFSGIFDSKSASKQMLHVIETWLSTINMKFKKSNLILKHKCMGGFLFLVFRIAVD